MRILFTGGLGFIGSNAVRYLVNNGFEVVVVDKQTYAANPEYLRKEIASKQIRWYRLDICTLPWTYLLEKEKIDVVVNMAASSHVDNSIDDAKDFIDTNYSGVHSILKGIREYQKKSGKKVLMMQFSSVTGETPVLIRNINTKEIKLLPIKDIEKMNVTEFETLALNKYAVEFKRIKAFIKHSADTLYMIKYTGGGKLTATGSHSVFVMAQDGIKAVRVTDLKPKDVLITFNGVVDIGENINEISVFDLFKNSYNSHIKETFLERKRAVEFVITHNITDIARLPRMGFQYNAIRDLLKYGYLQDSIGITQLGKDDYYKNSLNDLLWLIIQRRLHIPMRSINVDADLMWLFGLYLAEGNSDKRKGVCNNRVCFTVGHHEHDKIVRAESIFKKLNAHYRIKERESSWQIITTASWIHRVFNQFGSVAREKVIPTFVWYQSKENILSFLDGYAGDAAIKTTGDRIYTTVNKGLAQSIVWLTRLKGLNSVMNERRCKHVAHLIPPNCTHTGIRTYYDIQIRASTISNQFDRYPQSMCLPKTILTNLDTKLCRIKTLVSKQRLSKTLKRTDNDYVNNLIKSAVGSATIKDITVINESADVYDLSVEDTENFFGGNAPCLLHNTDEVAGDLPVTSVYEFTENAALLPNNPYSATKAAADLLIRAFSHTYNDFDWIIVRPTNNFGPHQHLEKFIPTVVSNAVKNQSIPIYGTGGNIREWIYTLDLSEGLVKLLNLYAQDATVVCKQVFNFGSGIRKTNLEIAYRILDLMGKPRDLITFVKDRLGHDRKYALDSKKAKDVLGWEPHLTMNFDACLKVTIEDILARLSVNS